MNLAKETIPDNSLMNVSDDEYESGFDIAYLNYPDDDGLYRMYEVLGRTFDEFMNNFVCGKRYSDFIEQIDNYYVAIMKIRKELGID